MGVFRNTISKALPVALLGLVGVWKILSPGAGSTIYVAQAAAGTGTGATAANAKAYSSLTNADWTSMQGGKLCIVGTVTSPVSIGAHGSSAAQPFVLDMSCDSLNQGSFNITGSSPAITIPSRNNTVIRRGTVVSSGGPGVRITGAVDNVQVLEITASNNGGPGVIFACNATYTIGSIIIRDSHMDSNAGAGVSCRPSGGVVTWNGLIAERNTTSENTGDGWDIYDTAPKEQATCHMIMNIFVFHDNVSNNNSKRGYRVNNQANLPCSGSLKFARNTANGNGFGTGEAGSGGFNLGSFKGSATTGPELEALAFLGEDGNGCYIGYNSGDGNRGMNQGMSTFGVKSCIIEHNSITNTYTTALNAACYNSSQHEDDTWNGSVYTVVGQPDCYDGACYMADENSDLTIFQFNYLAHCFGNEAEASGAYSSGQGIAILREAGYFVVRNNMVFDAKRGIQVTGHNLTQIYVYNNTVVNVKSAGIDHTNTIDDASQIHVTNNLITCDGTSNVWGTTYGYYSLEGPDSDAHHNLFYGCGQTYSGQAAGTGDVVADPKLAGTLFTIPADFKILSSSPARDAGFDTGYRNVDINGVVVPQNSRVDIGAAEYRNAACH